MLTTDSRYYRVCQLFYFGCDSNQKSVYDGNNRSLDFHLKSTVLSLIITQEKARMLKARFPKKLGSSNA